MTAVSEPTTSTDVSAEVGLVLKWRDAAVNPCRLYNDDIMTAHNPLSVTAVTRWSFKRKTVDVALHRHHENQANFVRYHRSV